MSIGKLTRNALPFSNVVASGVATSQITAGRTLENIQLKLGGTALTKAMLTDIKIKANGKAILTASGSQLDKLANYRGITANAAYLDIAFADITGLTEFDRMVGAFDTSVGIQMLTSEITIAGATAPTLAAVLYESAQQVDKTGVSAPYAGVISKVLRYPYSTAVGGDVQLQLPFGPNNGAIIKRLHIENAGGFATGVTLKADGLVLHESLKAQNEFEQSRFGRVPQANWYTLDFVLDGNVRKALDTRDVRSLELVPTFSAADSGYVIVEYLDVLGNL